MMTALLALAPMATFYIGTYTSPDGARGIYRAQLNLETGEISTPSLAIAAENPSFVALHPSRKFLYAVHETGTGEASAYRVEAGGDLKLINTKTGVGAYACHLAVDAPGKNLFTASYGGGTLMNFPIGSDGALKDPTFDFKNSGTGPDASRQEGPHMHAAYPSVNGKHVYACDLGTDEILRFDLDSNAHRVSLASPRSTKTVPGGGPRHLALSKNGKHAYVCDEMLSSVTAFDIDSEGRFTRRGTLSTLPAPTPGNSTAEIHLHPTGKWLYVSNRGHNSLAVYDVAADGSLSRRAVVPVGVKTPRGFAVDSSGKWIVVAGQDSNDLTSIAVDLNSGNLTPSGKTVSSPRPVCIIF